MKSSLFINNIWDADLADMQLTSKFIEGIRFLYVIDIFSKYAWVLQYLWNKRGITITNAFQKILDESNRNQLLFNT